MFERIDNVSVQVGIWEGLVTERVQPCETSSVWFAPNTFMGCQQEAVGSGLRWKAVEELELEDKVIETSDQWLKSTDKLSLEVLADS